MTSEKVSFAAQERWVLLLMVFFGGFANLATEIIGPRMFASMYGTATVIWAVIISVTLVGLSVGYSLGGRVAPADVRGVFVWVLLVNALWLLGMSWLVWWIPSVGGVSFNVIFTAAMAAFFVPSVLFGTVTPMSITRMSQIRPQEPVTTIAGNLYALGTVGSVLGALSASFLWIPYVGLSLSLRIFAAGLVLFALYFLRERRQWAAAGGTALLVLVMPQPSWQWTNTGADLQLLAQREGYYQTVRVYQEGEQYRQMNLGPTFHSKIDLETREPAFNYAQNMVRLADLHFPEMAGKNVLIIGGAGHAMAHALENRGGQVTEVEIDPIVVQLSDQYFGEINGEVLVMDGRVFMESATPASYDLIMVDAFDGGTGVPPQLSTREFYEAVTRALSPEGVMIYNFIGSPQGRLSSSYRAMARTIEASFPFSAALHTREDLQDRQNILFVGGVQPFDLPDLTPLAGVRGWLLTDDRNPLEMLHEQSREGLYFQR